MAGVVDARANVGGTCVSWPKEVAKPTFFVLGAAKAGATSIYELLRRHPDVHTTARKETNFFSFDHAQVLVVTFDDFVLDASATMARIFKHIGVNPPAGFGGDLRARPTATPRWRGGAMLIHTPRRAKAAAKRVTPPVLRRRVWRFLASLNENSARARLDDAMRRELFAAYEDDVALAERLASIPLVERCRRET